MAASDDIEARDKGIRKILALRKPSVEQKKRGKGRPKIVKRVLQPSKVEEGINPKPKWWNLIDIDDLFSSACCDIKVFDVKGVDDF